MLDVKGLQCSSHTTLNKIWRAPWVLTLYDKPWILFVFDKISTRAESIRVTFLVMNVDVTFSFKKNTSIY